MIIGLAVVVGIVVAILCGITPDNINFIIGVAGIVAVLVSGVSIANKKGENESLSLAIGMAIIVIISIFMSCFSRVNTGHTGILISFGKVQPQTYEAGIHFRKPWENMIQMDNRVQKDTVDMMAFSKDTQEVKVTYTLNYQINKESASNLYKTVGRDYFTVLISPAVLESVKTQTAKFTADQLIADRNDFAQATEEDLKRKLKEFNVDLVATNIEDIDFSDAYTNAVEQKQVALQEKLKAEQEAEKKKVEADANAYVKIKEAEGEAKANELRQKSLTSELIEYEKIQKWNGILPQVSGESNPIINLK